MLFPFQVFKTFVPRGEVTVITKEFPLLTAVPFVTKKLTYLRSSVSKTSASELRYDHIILPPIAQ